MPGDSRVLRPPAFTVSRFGVVAIDSEQSLVLVSGWTGAGKSTIAEMVARELKATICSFDWLMSALRVFPDIWPVVESPPGLQRRVGWELLARTAEQQLRRGGSCVLDLVAREEMRVECDVLAERYNARFGVIECVCTDEHVHRSRIEGRRRGIPGWYELDWEHVAAGRSRYQPLADPKLVVDAVIPLDANLQLVRDWLT